MRKFLAVFALSLLSLLFATNQNTIALNPADCEKEPIPREIAGACIDILNQKINDLISQKKTLASQITQFDSQIKITQLKIAQAQASIVQLEKEIGVLGFRISYITDSVERLETLLKQRIVATYQQSFISNLEILVSANDFSDLILRLHYLKIIQENDKKLLTNLQETKANYANQKDEREEKQAAIEVNRQKLLGLKTSLDQQKAEKQSLLEVTKNDEARFQRLLAQAQAEQAILFGGGTDSFMRDVNQGDSIGSIASHSISPGCSTGAHLHFEVHKDGSLQDPNKYLKPTSYTYASGYDQSYYGSVNPGGDLPWPLNEPITIHQGYGSHPFAQTFYSGGIHTGIDIDSGSSKVKSVKGGKLYGGSYNCSNGALYYAKVIHDDGITTWYLHMVPN